MAIASYAAKPKYTMLFGGLTATDQAGVVTEIQALGIPVQYDTAGTVEVPEGKAAEIRMRLATAGETTQVEPSRQRRPRRDEPFTRLRPWNGAFEDDRRG